MCVKRKGNVLTSTEGRTRARSKVEGQGRALNCCRE